MRHVVVVVMSYLISHVIPVALDVLDGAATALGPAHRRVLDERVTPTAPAPVMTSVVVGVEVGRGRVLVAVAPAAVSARALSSMAVVPAVVGAAVATPTPRARRGVVCPAPEEEVVTTFSQKDAVLGAGASAVSLLVPVGASAPTTPPNASRAWRLDLRFYHVRALSPLDLLRCGEGGVAVVQVHLVGVSWRGRPAVLRVTDG